MEDKKNGRLIKSINRLKMLLTSPNAKSITRFQFAVTYLCNSRCATCNIWRIYHNDPNLLKEELTFEEIVRIFSSIKDMKDIKQISFTGGEPFLRKDFVDIYLFFSKIYENSSLYLVTNGINNQLIIDKIERIKKESSLSRLKLGVSLDGIGKNHDKIRGIEGNYEKVLSLVNFIKSSYPEIELNLSFTISEGNFREIEEAYRISKENKALFSFRFAQVSGSYYQNKEMNFIWPKEILKEVSSTIDKITGDMNQHRDLVEKLFRLDVHFLKRLVKYQIEQRRIFNCYSGTHSFFLDPYGKIYPCINLSSVYGNAKEEDFNNFWFSKKTKSIREGIKRGKCHCWTECETIPSLQRSPLPLISNFLNFIFKLLNYKN
ncbi:MAG: radical SAM protein [bacterium]